MSNNKEFYDKKIKELFDKTIESDFRYNGKLDNIDYFSCICKATANDQMIRFQGSNLSMFNYRFNNKESVLMVFSIPLSNEHEEYNKQNKKKHVTERIMNIIKTIERFFITLDYIDCKQLKEDKFAYLTVVKIIDKQKEEEED